MQVGSTNCYYYVLNKYNTFDNFFFTDPICLTKKFEKSKFLGAVTEIANNSNLSDLFKKNEFN